MISFTMLLTAIAAPFAVSGAHDFGNGGHEERRYTSCTSYGNSCPKKCAELGDRWSEPMYCRYHSTHGGQCGWWKKGCECRCSKHSWIHAESSLQKNKYYKYTNGYYSCSRHATNTPHQMGLCPPHVPCCHENRCYAGDDGHRCWHYRNAILHNQVSPQCVLEGILKPIDKCGEKTAIDESHYRIWDEQLWNIAGAVGSGITDVVPGAGFLFDVFWGILGPISHVDNANVVVENVETRVNEEINKLRTCMYNGLTTAMTRTIANELAGMIWMLKSCRAPPGEEDQFPSKTRRECMWNGYIEFRSQIAAFDGYKETVMMKISNEAQAYMELLPTYETVVQWYGMTFSGALQALRVKVKDEEATEGEYRVFLNNARDDVNTLVKWKDAAFKSIKAFYTPNEPTSCSHPHQHGEDENGFISVTSSCGDTSLKWRHAGSEARAMDASNTVLGMHKMPGGHTCKFMIRGDWVCPTNRNSMDCLRDGSFDQVNDEVRRHSTRFVRDIADRVAGEWADTWHDRYSKPIKEFSDSLEELKKKAGRRRMEDPTTGGESSPAPPLMEQQPAGAWRFNLTEEELAKVQQELDAGVAAMMQRDAEENAKSEAALLSWYDNSEKSVEDFKARKDQGETFDADYVARMHEIEHQLLRAKFDVDVIRSSESEAASDDAAREGRRRRLSALRRLMLASRLA